MRTHASDRVSFTICGKEGGGEECRGANVGNNEVLAVYGNSILIKIRTMKVGVKVVYQSFFHLLMIVSFMCVHGLPV